MSSIVLVDGQVQEWPRSVGIGYLRGNLNAQDIKSSIWDLTAFFETSIGAAPPPQTRKEMLQRLLVEWIPLANNPPLSSRPEWNFDILSVKELSLFRQAWVNHCGLNSRGKIQKYLKQNILELIPEITINDLNIDPTDQENMVEETLIAINELYRPFERIPFIGFSLISNVLSLSILAFFIKELNNDVQVIFGGPFPSYSGFADLYLRYKVTDYCVRNEGEQTLLELLQGKNLPDITGLSYQINNKTYHNPPRPPLDLADLPLPIYDGYQDHRLTILGINTNRGCPFKCRFCAGLCVHRKFRKFPVKRIILEIEHLLENYPVELLAFVDSAINNDLPFIKQVLKEYNQQILPNLKKPLSLAATANLIYFDKEFADLVKKAGFRLLYFGIESTLPHIQKKFVGNKRFGMEEIREKLMLCQEDNLGIYGSFIIGFPGMTEEELNLEFEQIKELLPLIDIINLNAFVLEHDTFIARYTEKFGIKKESFENFYVKFYKSPRRITNDIDLEYPFLTSLGYFDPKYPHRSTQTFVEKIIKYTQQWAEEALGLPVAVDEFLNAASLNKDLIILPPDEYTSASG
ncbi:MAG: B12-binding domain-containing radical SAM protein [Candidatus Hermodarchaeota archaeon]